MAIQGKCVKCGEQEIRVVSDASFRNAVPGLSSFVQREITYACKACGAERHWKSSLANRGNDHRPVSVRPRSDDDVVHHKRVMVADFDANRGFISVQYPAVFRDGENILLPTFEGNVQDGTVVDRHGDPDWMAALSEEYLRQAQALMPNGRLPRNLKEIMPALLLLVTAAELVLKACHIRSEKPLKNSHSLVDLYEMLDSGHKQEAETRFTKAETNLALAALGVDGPQVTQILQRYSKTYGGESSVYKDVRYYAEPTAYLHGGSNLVKGDTPYPIFLPDVVRSLIDTFRHHSGSERLRRLGADLKEGAHDSGKDNHGHWGLIPFSLGLVVISVPQRAGKDASGEGLKVYQAFKGLYPTGFTADWKYGGNTHFFYRDGGQDFVDGPTAIDGLECRVWSKMRLGLHSRELIRLADALEATSSGDNKFGQIALQRP